MATTTTDGAKLFKQLETFDASQSMDDYLDASGEWDLAVLRQAIEKCPPLPEPSEQPSKQPSEAASSDPATTVEPAKSGSTKVKPESKQNAPTKPAKAPTKEPTATGAAAKGSVISKPPSLKKGAKAKASKHAKGRLLEVSPNSR